MSLPIVLLDFVSVLGNFAAIIILFKGWKKAFKRDTKFLFIGLLYLGIVYNLFRAIEWSGLGYYSLESLEDIAGALSPVVWAFVFYAMTQNIAQKDIIESKERYHTLVENIDLGITLVDTNHNIVMANSGLGKLLNCDISKLTGKKCYNEFEKKTELCPHCPGEAAMASGQTKEVETEALRDDGSRFMARIRAFPLFNENGNSTGFIEVVEDITERKKIEQAMRMIVEASSTSTGPDFFRSLVKAIAVALDFKYAFIGKLKAKKPESIETLAVWAGDDFSDNFEYDLAGTPCENIISKKNSFHANNVTTKFPKDLLIKELRVESYFGVPLLDASGQILGLLTVMDVSPVAQSSLSRIESILTIFASRVSSEMERIKNEQEIINIAKFPSENPTPVLRISGNGTVLYNNKAALEIIDPSKCLGSDQTINLLNQYVSKSLKSAKSFQAELKCCDKVYTLTFAPFPEFDYVNVYGLDITERKLAEKELKKTTEMLQLVMGNIPQFIFWKDRNSTYLGCNQNFARVAGFKSPEEIIGKTDYDMAWKKEEADFFRSCDERVMSSGQAEYDIIESQLQSDGKEAWLDTNKVPLCDKDGNVVGILGTYEDITERKLAEQKIRESEEYLRSIFRAAPTGIGVVVDRVFQQVNDKLCEMSGYSKEELIGQNARILYPSDEEYEYVGREKYSQISNHGTGTVETRWKRKDASIVDVLLSSTPLDISDLSKGVTFTALDITDRKTMEDTLAKEQIMLRTLLDNIPDPVYVKDRDGHFVCANATVATYMGAKTPDDLIGKSDYDFYVKEMADEYYADEQKIISTGEPLINKTEPMLDTHNKMAWVLTTKVPLRDVNDKIIGIVGVSRNITALKEAEDNRDRLNQELEIKNRELESILYAASHDLKSPLVNLQGFSHELSKSCKLINTVLASGDTTEKMEKAVNIALNEDIPNAVDFIVSSTKKMDSLLSGLLDICRLTTTATNIESIDMDVLIADVAENFEYQISQATAKVDIEPLPACIGNIAEINRVFSNLLSNAIKFLGPDRPGKIRISGQTLDHQSIYCVEDNGIGIDPEYHEKIFEIFYRLDPEKKQGDGVGLTIVKRIVEKHNGKVWLESEEGKGAKFYVSLPNI